jgi:acetyl esterase
MQPRPSAARTSPDDGSAAAERPTLDAHAAAFVELAKGLALPSVPEPEQFRARFSQLQRDHVVALLPTSVEQRIIPAGPTGSIRLRILRPQAAGERLLPIVFYFHGGGWIGGDAATHDRLMRELACGVPAAIVFVEYDLAPAQRFPVQNEQSYAALLHVANASSTLNLDASRIAVAGDDAGAAIAAAVTLLAKQRRGPEILFQLLLCPITGELEGGGSADQFRDGYWLTRAEMLHRFDVVFANGASRREITAFPMLASQQQLNDLPAALVITAECDILRDQGETYAQRLLSAGVNATSTRYNGTIHDFVVLNALAGSPATRGAIAQATSALRAALHDS